MSRVGILEDELLDALREVEDPELPVSIVDLGLIVSISVTAATARVSITFTAMGCPAMDLILDDVRDRLLKVAGISAVDIEIVWHPIWTKDRVSDEGKAALREYGISI